MRKYDYSDPVALTEAEKDVTDSNGLSLVIPRRYEAEIEIPEQLENFDWQITYKFSSGTRRNFFGGMSSNGNPVYYGAHNMTFRRLYLILCSLNGGVSFIDDYLENVLPYTAVGEELRAYLQDIKDRAEHEWQELYSKAPKRKADGGVYKRWLPKFDYIKAMTEATVKDAGNDIAKRIKEDLVFALRDGRVPLSTNLLATSTMEKRRRAGLNPTPRFYASSQFINNITIFCRLERKGTWKTDISV